MTFSIAGFCSETGMTGVAITTSSICVASRCPWVRAGSGAVATQNVTDPALGPRLLDLLDQGLSVQQAVDRLVASSMHVEYRQLLAVDSHGRTGHFTGGNILGVHAVSEGVSCIAAGNLLDNPDVPTAMTRRFAELSGVHLAERLLASLRAGVEAGGEAGPTHSAGLKVAHEQSWPLVDLRIDWTDNDPVAELENLWVRYQPQMNDYTLRALDPSAAPSYGVAGDP